MGITPESIDREEKARAQFLAIKAKREGNRIHISRDRDFKRGGKGSQISLGKYSLGFSSAAALGDAIRMRMLAAANARLNQKDAIEHVRNGIALTPHGEAMLKKAQTELAESRVMANRGLASGVAPTVGDRKDVNARSFRKTEPVNNGEGAGKAEPVA